MILQKQKKYVLFAGLLIVLISVILFHSQVSTAAQRLYNKWMVLSMIIEKIERFYVTEKDSDELLENAINGILSGLDPHSTYLNKEEYEDWKKRYEGFLGIGIKYNVLDGDLIVISVIKGSPAERAGIHIGDRIQAIEGRSTESLRNKDIHDLLIGPPHSTVELNIKTGSGQGVEKLIERSYVQPSSVPCFWLFDNNIGYIKIDHFTQSTPTELDLAFASLNSRNMQKLLLDLRDNSGGDFFAGVQVADRFIPGGNLIVFTKGRAPGTNEQFIATDATTLPHKPLLILVNEATASDAEIVAAAIQDWELGKIIGKPTFGKGLVQSEFPLQDGSALLLTTSQYFTPKGRSLQKLSKGSPDTNGNSHIGVIPDYDMSFDRSEFSDSFKKLYFHPQNPFLKFADVYTMMDSTEYESTIDFVQEFNVTDAVVDSFYNNVIRWGIDFSRSLLARDRLLVEQTIMREIAGRMWGDEGKYVVDIINDKAIQKALRYLN